jgi:hypothetical protein
MKIAGVHRSVFGVITLVTTDWIQGSDEDSIFDKVWEFLLLLPAIISALSVKL